MPGTKKMSAPKSNPKKKVIKKTSKRQLQEAKLQVFRKLLNSIK